MCAILNLVYTQNLYAEVVNYLYINAGEGTASGGHTALRFDQETYHFQHFPGGIIRLVKQASSDFDFQYRYLENRTLYQAGIELDSESYKQLRDHFNLRFLQQKQQDNLLKEIQLNLSLLESKTTDFNALLTIRGAGLFAPKTNLSKAARFNNQEINAQIKHRLGSTFLQQKTSQLEQLLVKIKPQPWPESALRLSKNTFISVPYSFAQQYIDTVSQLLFLQILENNTGLDESSYFSPEDQLFTLTEVEIEKLRQLQANLIDSLFSLLNSTRPDCGNATLILYARIISLAYSINSGHWVLLDTYADSSPSITYAQVAIYKAAFQAQQQEALSLISAIKQQLFRQPAITEKDYSHFERLSNYYYERERGLNKQHEIRTAGEQRLPSKSAPLSAYLLPKLNAQEIATAKTRLINYQANLTQQIQTLYPYDLFTHNCVTEIFAAIQNAEVDAEALVGLLNLINKDLVAFIPYLSFAHIAEQHSQQVSGSFREQQLEKMYAEENNLRVYLREFNTLSARDYKFNELDAPFLFFTHEQVWSRPLFGAFNLMAAASIAVYGSFTWPFDAGANLKKGAMGLLMSLPELAFFNIRKGSYKHLAFSVRPD
ncbi:MAG: hypothetical protein RQ733_07505 [Methyloprofundus sp.]|nr:hypothetical protein [Methyloprofundus sp.]MDT8425806.1 hypothetical protein [Methyloprofundus sp.]